MSTKYFNRFIYAADFGQTIQSIVVSDRKQQSCSIDGRWFICGAKHLMPWIKRKWISGLWFINL